MHHAPCLIVALAYLLSPTTVLALPVVVEVPAHAQYCITSNPIGADQYAKADVRDALFDTLSQKVETAVQAQAETMGVPFVDNVRQAPVAAPGTAPDVTIKVCAVVAQAVAPLLNPHPEQLAKKTVAAMVCDTANLDDCDKDVEAALRASPGGSATKPISFRTRQALSSDTTTSAIVAALTDTTLIRLREAPAGNGVATAYPTNFAVVSAEFN